MFLKPASSDDLRKISREPEDFSTSNVNHFCSMQFRGWGVGAKIINNDSQNVCGYRLHSNRGTLRIVPISSEITINEWFDLIFIEPDSGSGSGQLEIDVVGFEDAKKDSKN